MEYPEAGGMFSQELTPLAALLRAAAIPHPTRPGSGCCGARHQVTAKAIAALPAHTELIARPKKLATGAEKVEVMGWRDDFG